MTDLPGTTLCLMATTQKVGGDSTIKSDVWIEASVILWMLHPSLLYMVDVVVVCDMNFVLCIFNNFWKTHANKLFSIDLQIVSF